MYVFAIVMSFYSFNVAFANFSIASIILQAYPVVWKNDSE